MKNSLSDFASRGVQGGLRGRVQRTLRRTVVKDHGKHLLNIRLTETKSFHVYSIPSPGVNHSVVELFYYLIFLVLSSFIPELSPSTRKAQSIYTLRVLRNIQQASIFMSC